jgi:2-hydroxychromene-2-carboxylate isomerase
MPKFILTLAVDRLDHVLPSWKRLVEIAHENNTDVQIDPVHAGAVMAVTCENKPRDMPEYGLKWEEVE